MKYDSLDLIKQQLSALEEKMLAEVKKKQDLLKSIHSKQQPAAKNLLHYLTLRNEDIRELQDWLHIHGLSSLASSESHIHRQLQAILQRLGNSYPAGQLDPCTYAYNQQQIVYKSQLLFGKKKIR